MEAGAGDDTICATGVRWIAAGDGNDRVSHVEAPRGHVVVLGAGSDLFEGSDVRDRVLAEDIDDDAPAPGTGPDNTDVVRTYGGKDRVVSGDGSQVNHDVVVLGAGPDSLDLTGAAGGTAEVRGGRGADSVTTRVAGTTDLDVDLRARRVLVDGSVVATLAGIEDVVAGASRGAVRVRGTGGRNVISVSGRDGRVRAGGGADVVELFGCGSVGRGGPGGDVLRSTYQGCRRDPVTLYGDAGDDRLRGSRAPDVLIGGAGRDFAAGGRGKDVCRAERERSCERGHA